MSDDDYELMRAVLDREQLVVEESAAKLVVERLEEQLRQAKRVLLQATKRLKAARDK